MNLHLRPRSAQGQRNWYVGEAGNSRLGDQSAQILDVRPDCHRSFASFESVLDQLSPRASAPIQEDVAFCRTIMKRCENIYGTPQDVTNDSRVDAVVFAVMRRISRESVLTGTLIDMGARLLNALLAERGGAGVVHLCHADRLDRPSLKIFARAALLLTEHDGFCWSWHTSLDPRNECTVTPFLRSRSALLRQIASLMAADVQGQERTIPVIATPESRTIREIASALVVQNYDACFLWGDAALRDPQADSVEVTRLLGLATINAGDEPGALALLRQAETQTTNSARRAHLAYLQGLIEAKRAYDVDRSDATFRRGLEFVATARAEDGDVPLERAWLLNGLALNESIRARTDSKAGAGHFKTAFQYVHEAFDLVAGGDSSPRTYLRFNLLANSTLLLEMQQAYQRAAALFESTFSDEFHTSAGASLMTFDYRLAALHARGGDLDRAAACIGEAETLSRSTPDWAMRERVLRAVGYIALQCENLGRARDAYEEGLALSLHGRFAIAATQHARGLMAVYRAAGKTSEADSVETELRRTEGLECRVDGSVPPPELPSTKLPAYIPELDLEGIPQIDMNRFLSALESRNPFVGAFTV